MGQASSQPAAQCPAKHDAHPSQTSSGQCPVPHASTSSVPKDTPPPQQQRPPAECPMHHEGSGVNPFNQMPTLSQSPSPNQSADLPVEREVSSIPRDTSTKWEYPSPQQFYNALVRKGWETPEEHVETMVQIHNFLNEQAWLEILKWEKKENPTEDPQLSRFKGRPGELSPKARFWLFAGWLFPSRFNTEPPFDRHDWIVRRTSTGEEVRYVIDYYSAPPEPDGSPVFSLDVRPALDSLGSIKQRISVATEDVWTSFKENGGRSGVQNS